MSPPTTDRAFEALHIAHISPEMVPFASTGGLGEVLGTLPGALSRLGLRQTVVTPLHIPPDGASRPIEPTGRSVSVRAGDQTWRFEIHQSAAPPGVRVLLLECPTLFGEGSIYGGPHDALRFLAFGRAAVRAAGAFGGERPDILHLHDWTTGLIAWEMARVRGRATPTVYSIHNLAMQGIFGREAVDDLALPLRDFHPGGYEFWGGLGFAKAALVYADRVTTVSPTYAREITSDTDLGMGLDGVLRARRDPVVGILNGIDTERWNPATADDLAAAFGVKNLRGKRRCTDALRAELGLVAPERGRPRRLAVFVGRLTPQKGADLLGEAVAGAVDADRMVLALLGSGDPDLEEAMRDLAKRWPGRVAVHIGFDAALARRMFAGGDLLLMPSRFEPSGLAQLIAMRFGTLPVVRGTGGLVDSVEDGRTGFVFGDPTSDALAGAIDRALGLLEGADATRRLRRRLMSIDWSWDRPARAYARLYEETWRAWLSAGQA